MTLAVFGSRKTALPATWVDESAGALFGSVSVDASAGAGPAASLRVFALFGSVMVRVPPESRIREAGFSLFGERSVECTPGGGPEIELRAYTLFGSVEVTDRAQRR